MATPRPTVKCPKCRSTNVRVTIFATSRRTYHQCSDKGFIRVFGGEDPQENQRAAGVCGICKHRWNTNATNVELDDGIEFNETCAHHYGTDYDACTGRKLNEPAKI